MKSWLIFLYLVMVLFSTERGHALTCYGCGKDPSDPFCQNPDNRTCHAPNQMCYEIHIKNIGISKGCTIKIPLPGEKTYCDRYLDTLEPLIYRCKMCDNRDLCNDSGANGIKLCHSMLLVVGVLIGIGCVGVRLVT